MGEHSVYVGVDVHARSIAAQTLDRSTGAICKKRFGAGYGAEEIAEWVKGLGESLLRL